MRRLLAVALLSPLLATGQEYVAFAPQALALDEGPPAFATITLSKSDGRTVALPWVDEQTGFRDLRISPDGKRVGWVTLKHNICCSDPIGMVVFADDGIERVIDGCISNWRFGTAGSVITFWTEPCHNASTAQFIMMDTATGQWIAEYHFDYQVLDDTDGKLPADAPGWVHELYDRPVAEPIE